MKLFAMLFLLIFSASYADESQYFSAIGAPICGYGQYHIGDKCYKYGVSNNTLCDGSSVTGAACLGAFVESSGEFENMSPFSGGFADIGAPTDIVTREDVACGGDGSYGAACLGAFVESSGEFIKLSPFAGGFADIGAPTDIVTREDIACGGDGSYGAACLHAFVESSGAIEEWYPFVAGFTDIGSPSDTFIKMREKDCLGTMDGYYVTDIPNDMFQPQSGNKCASGTDYIIPNDCQYIDMTNSNPDNVHSGLFPENWLCAVLCDTGKLYTGTGICATPCNIGGENQRLHIGGTVNYSAPLYVEKLTSPAMAFRFGGATNPQMCYMNLLPSDGKHPKVSVQYQNNVYHSSY